VVRGGPLFYQATIGVVVVLGALGTSVATGLAPRDLSGGALPFARARLAGISFAAEPGRVVLAQLGRLGVEEVFLELIVRPRESGAGEGQRPAASAPSIFR